MGVQGNTILTRRNQTLARATTKRGGVLAQVVDSENAVSAAVAMVGTHSHRLSRASRAGCRNVTLTHRLDRGFPPRESLPLPSKPPFTAHLGNLSFDATEGDIQDFFSGCSVTSVRIVEDKMERKPKGFGYVEFGTLDGLKKALDLNSTQFQGRNIRISIAEPRKSQQSNQHKYH